MKPGADAPLVLVGTPDERIGKMLLEALESWGMRAVIVSDGVEAMLEIQRQLPAVVVLAPTLPRMYGFQVCEIVKRNESLQATGVILLGAIHHPDRYRRPPEELYGADAYVEEPDLPDALLTELRGLGILASDPAVPTPTSMAEGTEPGARAQGPATDPVDSSAPSPLGPPAVDSSAPSPLGPPAVETSAPSPLGSPAVETSAPSPLGPPAVGSSAPSPLGSPAVETSGAEPTPAPAPAPRAPTEMGTSPVEPVDELTEARAQAERLARIIVSDIVLYNEEKFAAAIEAGTVAESLGPDLEEGRGLFRDRVDSRLQDEKDYLTEELLRVARTRGMQ